MTMLEELKGPSLTFNRKVLVIDDSRSIQEDYRKILAPPEEDRALDLAEAELFGGAGPGPGPGRDEIRFQLEAAMQGEDGVDLVTDACRDERPYAMAFVDVRMPPGWNGVETTRRLWEADPRLQVVICSAYSDHSWEDIVKTLGPTDRLVILKKPFETIEVRQLALAMTTKWNLSRDGERMQREMEAMIDALTYELEKRGESLPPGLKGFAGQDE